MNVQFNPQYSYTSQKAAAQKIYSNSYIPSFSGTEGDEFLRRVDDGMQSSDIPAFIVENLTNCMGGVKKGKLQDVLETVLKRIRTGENSIKKRKEGLDSREQDLRLDEQVLESQKAKLAKDQGALDERKESLNQLEQDIRNNTRQEETERIRQEVKESFNEEFKNKKTVLEQQYENKRKVLEQQYDEKRQSLVSETEAKRQNLESEINAKRQELDDREKELNMRIEAMDDFDKQTRIDIRAELEQEFSKQREEIEAARQEIAAQEKGLKIKLEQANAYFEATEKEIASKLRTLYKIPDDEVQDYENYGEQMVVTSRMLNNHSHVLRNCSDNTIVNLVDAMKDNNGHISAEILKATENILKEKTYCYVDDLPEMIKAIKDENGGLDSDKYGYCIALLAMPGTSFYSVLDSMTKKFKLTGNPAEKLKCPEPSFVAPYKTLVSHNMLKGNWGSNTYWNDMTSGCNKSLNTKLEYLSIEKKKEYIDALEITQYWARYHNCDTTNQTSEAISKVISRLQTPSKTFR